MVPCTRVGGRPRLTIPSMCMHSYIYTPHALMPFLVRGTKQIWHHTVLPAMEKEPDESAADFSLRVQKAVADHLGIKCSNGELVQESALLQRTHRTAPHRTAPHRTAPHRTASTLDVTRQVPRASHAPCITPPSRFPADKSIFFAPITSDNWAVKDMFFQATGLMPFTPEIWEKVRLYASIFVSACACRCQCCPKLEGSQVLLYPRRSLP